MKEICKNCGKCRPTYKGGICEKTGKKTKLPGPVLKDGNNLLCGSD